MAEHADFDRWLAGAKAIPSTVTPGRTTSSTEHNAFRWLFGPMLTAAVFEITAVDFATPVFGAGTCVKR